LNRVTTTALRLMKARGEKIAVLTGYDWTTARILDASGIDVVLVGDSLGMVMLGYDTTLPVTMEDMVHHTAAVARACSRALVVADMPFMSYQASTEEALRNAGRLLKQGGAQAVKLEGGREIADTVARMVEAGIPVMGHLGLTPQSVHQFGGYKVQGRGDEAADRLLADAEALERAGAFGLVLECIPTPLAERVSGALAIPTIGIGAGPGCDGQVLVLQDMAGLYDQVSPRFVKRYADLRAALSTAVAEYIDEVKTGAFPAEEHCFKE
jgi:3-methyl-2-oxobutanoate hydroxymethyltransferase